MIEQKHSRPALARGVSDGIAWIGHGTCIPLGNDIEYALELYQPGVRKLEYFSSNSPSVNGLNSALRVINSDTSGTLLERNS